MEDFRPTVVVTNAVLISLTSAAIACRVGRRVFLVGVFSWHDVLIALAAVSASIFSVLQIVSTRFGVGLTMADVPASSMATILKLVMASRIFYFICNWAVKHSLLLFYATLTLDHYPRLSIYALHVAAFAFGTTCLLATILECNPIRKMWRGPSVPGSCINMDHFNYFNSCFMLATDAILYAMPLVFTWKLHVSRPQRVAVNLLFALGGLVLAASGARIYFVHAQATHPDFTHRHAMTMLCAAVENHVAILVACAPSIKAILLRAFPALELSFDRLVIKGSPPTSHFSGPQLARRHAESASWLAHKSVLVTVHPSASRFPTDESGKSRSGRKWWQAPSSWDVSWEDETEEEYSLAK